MVTVEPEIEANAVPDETLYVTAPGEEEEAVTANGETPKVTGPIGAKANTGVKNGADSEKGLVALAKLRQDKRKTRRQTQRLLTLT